MVALVYDRAVQTVCEAAGGEKGLLCLAQAWHARVMADEVVSHAFSHGFPPDHSERLAAYWTEALGGPRYSRPPMAMKARLCGFTAATARMRRWTVVRSHVLITRSATLASRGKASLRGCCTTTSLGRPRRRCLATTSPRTRCRRTEDLAVVVGRAHQKDRQRRDLSAIARRCRQTDTESIDRGRC